MITLKNQPTTSSLIPLLIVSIMLTMFTGYSLSWAQVPEEEMFKEFSLLAEVIAIIQTEHLDKPEAEKLFYAAIKGMLATLDPYSEFLDPESKKSFQENTRGTFGGLGMYIGVRDNKLTVISPMEDTPAYNAGVQAGDYISEINGESTVGILVGDAVQKLRGEPGTQVTITIIREGEEEPIRLTITRDIITIQTVKSHILNNDIGYIRITGFMEHTAADVDKAFDEIEQQQKDIKGIILDLRNNPGGLLTSAVDIASDFLAEGKLIVYTKGRQEDQKEEFFVPKGATHKPYPLIVLVDNGSASGSEIVAGAIKDYKRGLIIGTKTFGKASVQKVIPIGGNLGIDAAVKLTVAHYYTPNGTDINKIGIEPDVEYQPESSSERKMWWKLRRGDTLKKFLQKAGEDILIKLKAAQAPALSLRMRGDEKVGKDSEVVLSQYEDFVKELEKEQIFLSDELIKFAIAAETKDPKDEYEYDPRIQTAVKHLQAYDVFKSKF
ncbi:S41 family peptidase [Candidatus Poribacteria bacterium]|nr:S41 family peptidase [Candidatus Poribacteria bacterium]